MIDTIINRLVIANIKYITHLYLSLIIIIITKQYYFSNKHQQLFNYLYFNNKRLLNTKIT